MKKALIFDPYLDTLGGGERYTLSFALGLIQNGYDVEVAWSGPEILSKATSRFGMDFSQLSISSEAYKLCSQKSSLLDRFLFTKKFDLIFWVSDGSIPMLFSKSNLVHFQVPFRHLGGNWMVNSLKSLFVSKFVYNSEFTKNVLERNLRKQKSFLLYPPVDVSSMTVGSKDKLILSVARFSSTMQSKRQDILIEAFRDLCTKISGYKLILVGGLAGEIKIIDDLRSQAKNLPIEIIPNPDFAKLKELYSRSQFFWHAAGYDVDEEKNPERVEHFGMTTVEAMSAGCIPLVIAKGGQKEVITSDAGVLCADQREIAEKTIEIINDPDKYAQMVSSSIARSKDFSLSKFYDKIKLLL